MDNGFEVSGLETATNIVTLATETSLPVAHFTFPVRKR